MQSGEPTDPALRERLGVELLALGDYRRGFRLVDGRPVKLQSAANRLPFPEWKGEALCGKSIMIWPEMGFGDQIMMARFVPVLQAMGARVTLVCAPPLLRLFREIGADDLVARAPFMELTRHDFWTLPFDIPKHLGTTLETIPPGVLFPPAVGPAKGFGLVWRGSPHHPNDAERSLPSPPDLGVPMVDLQDPPGDFADTAAIVSGLEAVVTVDTATAHLCGAMGKRCIVLLSAARTDWRWLRGRADSPWYPSVELVRQDRPGDWGSAISRAKSVLLDPDHP